jgi:hypothetical protein
LPRTGGTAWRSGTSWVTSFAVAAGEGCGERDAGGAGDQVMLTARSAPVDGASSSLGAPLTPGCGSRRPPPGRSPGRLHCGVRQGGPRAAGAIPRLRSTRRQQVMPEPKPSSCGRCSQAIPVCSTNRIPWNTSRSGCRLRPGC